MTLKSIYPFLTHTTSIYVFICLQIRENREKGGFVLHQERRKFPSPYNLGLGDPAANLGIGYVYGHFINPDKGQALYV